MSDIRKREGFKGEKIIVLPDDFIRKSQIHPLVKPLYLTDIGYFPDALYHFRERKEGCRQYILIYCIKGKGFLTMDDKTTAVSGGHLFVIPKNKTHCYGSDKNEPWSIYWVHFGGYNARHFVDKLDFSNPIIPVSFEKSAEIKLLFGDMINYIENGYTYEQMIYISQMLSHLLGLIFYSDDFYKGSDKGKTPIEESMRFMSDNIEKCYSLKQFASRAGLSVTHFSFLFKDRTGFSPIDYFIKLKIQKACRYLDLTDLKINEIAGKVGFNDPYYFSRMFYKVMRISPRDYRNIKKG